VKRLKGALLILGIFASTALAQSAEQVMKDQHRVLAGWLGTVRAAESKYKSKYGVYGDLTALRDAHLLDALVFESDKPSETGPDTNLVPKSTQFEVTASSDGKHYNVSIGEILELWSIGVSANEMSTGYGVGRRLPPPPPPPKDGPEGPLLSLPG
jgi:hypothetical protein